MNTRNTARRTAMHLAVVLAIALPLTACRTASADLSPTPTPRPTLSVGPAAAGEAPRAPAVAPQRVLEARLACNARIEVDAEVSGYTRHELCRMGTIHLYPKAASGALAVEDSAPLESAGGR